MVNFVLGFFAWDILSMIFVTLAILCWCSNEERNTIANIFMIIVAIVMYWTHPGIYTWIYNNPIDFIVGIITYVVIGIIWAFFKFKMHIREKVKELIKEHDESTYAEWHIENTIRRGNKYRIIFWIQYWIPSMLWTFADDFCLGLGRSVYNMFYKRIEKIEDDAIKTVLSNIKGEKKNG
jgi:hypothetical protein